MTANELAEIDLKSKGYRLDGNWIIDQDTGERVAILKDAKIIGSDLTYTFQGQSPIKCVWLDFAVDRSNP